MKKKKQKLGCAIHIKEYTIMMYLTNQIPSFNNNEPWGLIDNISLLFGKDSCEMKDFINS